MSPYTQPIAAVSCSRRPRYGTALTTNARRSLNVGDVIIADDDDVYGDGVNPAARLEALAGPGGMCHSDAAYRQVVGRVDQEFRCLGEQRLKNIPSPFVAWSLGPSSKATGSTDRRSWVALGELVGSNPRSGTEVVRLGGELVDARLAAAGEAMIVGTGRTVFAMRPEN